MADIRPDVRAVRVGTCPRCGAPLPQRKRGRPPKWCSQRCRREAYEERRAAAAGVVAIEFVRPAEGPKEHDLGECHSRVVGSPTACRRVLQEMTPLARDGQLVGDPKWEPVIEAVGRFADALGQRPASKSRFKR
jgi:hypothetical protein